MIRPAVILGHLGRIITIIGTAMLFCLPWSIVYHEDIIGSMAGCSILAIASGLLLKYFFTTRESINFKEGFALVTLGWVVASLFGSLPFFVSGYLPSFADAWFETVSGFTTTGASVVSDIESWPRGLLFWRSLTQWLGGMGIIALFVATAAGMGVQANQLFKAEVPGPIPNKLSPRIQETARRLWKTYVILSLACVLILSALGMEIFDALCHTFATMATGGFSTKNASIAYFTNPLIQWTIIIFMFIAGINFALHYMAFTKFKPSLYIKDAEFKLYGFITLTACILVTLGLHSTGSMLGWEERIRTACFQVVSILTTTGFASADYDQWPSLAAGVIFFIMFIGGCAGSTAGGIKPGRYLIILRRTTIELKKMIHPRAVLSLRFGGKILGEDLLVSILQFFFLYMMFFALGSLILMALGLDILSSLSAAATCIGNIGPGFNLVGPTQNFGFIPDIGKYVLSILMLVGRLEIYPVLVLLSREYWQH